MDEENRNLIFRIYQPTQDDMKQFVNLIEVEPYEARYTVDSIVKNAIENSPDKEGVQIQLVPKKSDVDLKRAMQPDIDKLLASTRHCLKDYVKKQKEQKLGD